MTDPNDPFKWYFEIDTEWVKKYIDQLLNKIEIKNIEGFSPVMLPVNGYFSNTEDGKITTLYLGNNHYNEGIWKKKHFIHNKLQSEYVSHLQSHAGYFLYQPKYYKGLYEILN